MRVCVEPECPRSDLRSVSIHAIASSISNTRLAFRIPKARRRRIEAALPFANGLATSRAQSMKLCNGRKRAVLQSDDPDPLRSVRQRALRTSSRAKMAPWATLPRDSQNSWQRHSYADIETPFQSEASQLGRSEREASLLRPRPPAASRNHCSYSAASTACRRSQVAQRIFGGLGGNGHRARHPTRRGGAACYAPYAAPANATPQIGMQTSMRGTADIAGYCAYRGCGRVPAPRARETTCGSRQNMVGLWA